MLSVNNAIMVFLLVLFAACIVKINSKSKPLINLRRDPPCDYFKWTIAARQYQSVIALLPDLHKCIYRISSRSNITNKLACNRFANFLEICPSTLTQTHAYALTLHICISEIY